MFEVFVRYLLDITMFNLNINKLKTLPEWIGKLKSLESFYISENQLGGRDRDVDKLIKVLSKLPKNCIVSIDKNNFTNSQKDLIRQDQRLKHLIIHL